MFSTLDHTQTGFGRRVLAGWVRQPLLSPEDIGARQVGARVVGRAVQQAASIFIFIFSTHDHGRLFCALPVPCGYSVRVRVLIVATFW